MSGRSSVGPDARTTSVAVLVVLPAVATAVALVLLALGDAGRIGAYGLVQAVHPVVGVCAVALVACAVLELHRGRRTAVLLTCVLGLIAILYAAPALIEQAPRFATAYTHAGFVERIQRTGQVLPDFDARFSWPAFFAAGAVVNELSGLDSALPLLPWSSLLLEVLYLPPLLLLVRALVEDRAVRWLAVVLFYVANWVGQDYYSPQGVTFLLYLVVLSVVVTWFGPATPAVGGWPRWAGPALVDRLRFADAAEDDTRGPVVSRGLLLLVLTCLVLAMTVTHQLTPVTLGIATAGLVVLRLTRLLTLPVLVTVATVAWLSFAATDYWVGHFADVTGDVGQVGASVGSNVGQRFGGSVEHQRVLVVRLAVTLLVWSLAAWTLVRPAARGQVRAAAAVLAAAPFPIVLLNSYGGEALLRVYLYALPAVSVLAAQALWRPGWRASAVRPWLAGAVVTLLLVAFPVARYGNERFEMVRAGEARALAWVYAEQPPGTTLYSVSGQLSWRYTALEDYRYENAFDRLSELDVDGLVRDMAAQPGAAVLVLTRGQLYDLEDNAGLGPEWSDPLLVELAGAQELTVLHREPDAVVLGLTAAGAQQAVPRGTSARDVLGDLAPDRPVGTAGSTG